MNRDDDYRRSLLTEIDLQRHALQQWVYGAKDKLSPIALVRCMVGQASRWRKTLFFSGILMTLAAAVCSVRKNQSMVTKKVDRKK